MTNNTLSRYAAWSAFGAAAAWVISITAIILYFALIPGDGRGDIFGPINDVSTIFSSLLMIPVMLALARLTNPVMPRLSQAALAISTLAWLTMAFGQILFVFGLVDLAFTYNLAAVSGLAGTAILVFHWLARRERLLPRRLTTIAIVASLGAVIGAVAILVAGMEHPLTWVGVLSYLLSPIWLVWFGRLLQAERLPAVAAPA